MIDMITRETVQLVYRLYPNTQEQERLQRIRKTINADRLRLTHDESVGFGLSRQNDEGDETNVQKKPKVQQIVADDKVGRNDVCPCGSGKKYKNCHGA